MKITLNWPDSIPASQFSKEFLQGMLNRMAFGYHNYGPASENFPNNYDAVKSMRQRVKKYKQSKNTEFLIDAGNYMMIEFLYPKVKGAFFEATSKADSPGAVLNDGRISKGKEHFDPKIDKLKTKKKNV